ncbi:MAG: tRNA-dihydrouridine synthase family protein, partial [Prevotellaceae bacterium]|nr:tRNA-dihydrouridine synthase family protein [Prevotellaceae bacterium]
MKPLHFAPLQGYTDDVYRRLHHRLVGGIAAYYTPFVRWEHGGVRSKDLRDIAPEHNEGVPLVPQVIAADADELARLVDVIAPLGYRRIDLNMGCPFPLQARHGRGSGLLPLPERAADLFERMRTYPELAFSVKLRLGWDDTAQLDRLAPLVAAAPLVSVTLHPRLGVVGYKGTADRAAFARFAAVCPHPLLYNGDLLTPSDVEAFVAAQPTVAGVMIGRGLLARPSL